MKCNKKNTSMAQGIHLNKWTIGNILTKQEREKVKKDYVEIFQRWESRPDENTYFHFLIFYGQDALLICNLDDQ